MKQSEYVEQILLALKEEVALMREMVIVQLEKAKRAFFDNDLDLAREIISREKRVGIDYTSNSSHTEENNTPHPQLGQLHHIGTLVLLLSCWLKILGSKL